MMLVFEKSKIKEKKRKKKKRKEEEEEKMECGIVSSYGGYNVKEIDILRKKLLELGYRITVLGKKDLILAGGLEKIPGPKLLVSIEKEEKSIEDINICYKIIKKEGKLKVLGVYVEKKIYPMNYIEELMKMGGKKIEGKIVENIGMNWLVSMMGIKLWRKEINNIKERS